MDRWNTPPTDAERAKVKRELVENCIVSEMLASMMLFVIMLTDIVLDAMGLRGFGDFSNRLSHAQRLNALGVYTVMMTYVLLFCKQIDSP